MKKKVAIISIIFIGILAVLMMIANTDKKNKMPIAEVQKGKLLIGVSATGEISPVKQTNIEVSNLVTKLRIYRATIADIVPEGTIVNEGDYVATLKTDELQKDLEKYEINLEELERDLELKKIDTTIQLKNSREQILEQKLIIEEAVIKHELSIYEPPASQRKAKIAVDKAERNLRQKERNYEAKIANSHLKTKRIEDRIKEEKEIIKNTKELIKAYTITAPTNGMITYYNQQRRGRQQKRTEGSVFWVYYDRVVAILPDLSEMISVTYINETDISKIKIGQNVLVTADAYGDIELSGKIKKIANIGEIQSGTGAKVFRTEISIKDIPEGFRPGMTTSNTIVLKEHEDVIIVPIEAVHTENEKSFVYVNGFSIFKQYVETGDSNDDYIIISSGLSEGEEVLLVSPEDFE